MKKSARKNPDSKKSAERAANSDTAMPEVARAEAGDRKKGKKPADVAKPIAKSSSPGKLVKSTKIDLASNTRTEVAAILNERLADGIDLALATKQAHWNLKGPGFIGVHLMLDGFRKELDSHVDTVAERIAQLGGIALGTTQTTARASSLAPYPTDIVSVGDHLEALIERYAATANAVREAIDTTDDTGDAGTADILTAYSRMLDKALWFLQSNVAP
jgi:starvation-inducible DNA-binding protein